MMRLTTGREVEWVEGSSAASHEVYTELLPDGTDPIEVDCPAYVLRYALQFHHLFYQLAP